MILRRPVRFVFYVVLAWSLLLTGAAYHLLNVQFDRAVPPSSIADMEEMAPIGPAIGEAVIVVQPDEPSLEQAVAMVPAIFDWPALATQRTTLRWPTDGCNAGVASRQYELEQLPTVTRVTTVDSGLGEIQLRAIDHEPNWLASWHPTTPTSGWAVAWNPTVAVDAPLAFEVQYWRAGAVACVAEPITAGVGHTDLRAAVVGEQFAVYRRAPDTIDVSVYGSDCEPVAARALPASVLSPEPLTLLDLADQRTATIVADQLQVSASKRELLVINGSDTVWRHTLGAEEPVLRRIGAVFTLRGKNAIVLVDDERLRLLVFDADLQHVRTFEFANQQPWTDPITHAGIVVGSDRWYLTVRGSLDDSPWNAGREWIRAWDLSDGRLVADLDARRVVDLSAPQWRWPDTVLGEEVRVCSGTTSAYDCYGQRVVAVAHDVRQSCTPEIEIEIRRDWNSDRETCRASQVVSRDIELRTELHDGLFTVFGRDDTHRYSWTWDLGCQLRNTASQPIAPPI